MLMRQPNAAHPLLRQRFKLRLLRTLLILEEEGTISRAAERLCISAAAVSKAKSEIETEIGEPVFERAGNRMRPTELGKQVIDTARRVFAELETLSGEIHAYREGLGGALTIGVRTIAGLPFIAEVTTAFANAHPGLRVQLLDADFPSLLDRLLKGDIQLLIGRLDSAVLPDEVEGRLLLSDPNVVIASPGHPHARMRRPAWRDLVKQRWCLTPQSYSGRISREHLKIHLAGQGLKLPAQVIEANSLLMQVALFQSGPYLSIAPMLLARQLERRGMACLLDLPPIGPVDPVCLMWPGNIALPSAARRFRDFMIARLDERPESLEFESTPARRLRRARLRS